MENYVLISIWISCWRMQKKKTVCGLSTIIPFIAFNCVFPFHNIHKLWFMIATLSTMNFHPFIRSAVCQHSHNFSDFEFSVMPLLANHWPFEQLHWPDRCGGVCPFPHSLTYSPVHPLLLTMLRMGIFHGTRPEFDPHHHLQFIVLS